MNYKEYKLNKGEWLETRGIGGSDLAAIFQESKWQTYNDVYNRLIGRQGKKKDLSANTRVQEGVALEPLIRKMWQIERPSEKLVEPPSEKNWIFVSTKNEKLTVSPDGLMIDDKGVYVGGLEIKDVEVRSKEQLAKWQTGVLPEQYYYQLMQYFIVIDTIQKVVLHARIKIVNRDNEIERVEEYDYVLKRKSFKSDIKSIEFIENEFINRYVNKFERPNANYLRLIEKDYNLWKKSKKAM